MPIKIPEREYRSFAGGYDLSESEENKQLIVAGTAIVFDTPTVMCVIDGIEYREQICSGALDSADMSDFIFNVNHELTPYARSKNGSLEYSISDNRFDIKAYLDYEDARHRQLYGDIKSRRIDQMSFSFTVAEQSYDNVKRLRSVRKIKKLYDASAVTFPAYSQTSISARGFFEEEFRKEFKHMEDEQRRRRIYLKTFT